MNTEISKQQWLEIAQQYILGGWSIIPVNGKISFISWKQYQSKIADLNTIKEWIEDPRFTGLAVVTGKLSKVVVLDIDSGSEFDISKLPSTTTSKTGSYGYHFYFKYPENLIIKNYAGFIPHTDIRGEGGYAVLPPSIHPETGIHYEWERNGEIANFPEYLLEMISVHTETKKTITSNELSNFFTPVVEGSRNDSASKLVGYLLSKVDEQHWENIVWPAVELWNNSNQPPMDTTELRSVFDSISSREKSKSQDNNSLDSLSLDEFITLDELYQTDFSGQRWLVDKLVPMNGITCLAGEPKVGKSFLTLEIAKTVSMGAKLFGQFDTLQTNVLLVSKEDPEWMIKDRFELLQTPNTAPITIITNPSIFLDREKHIQDITEYIKNNNIGLVIIDSLRRVIRGDENNSQSVNPIHRYFKQFIKAGATVIFIHHYGKDNENKSGVFKARGSSDIPALVDCLIGVNRNDFDNSITIRQEILRQDTTIDAFVTKLPEFSTQESSFPFIGYLSKENTNSSKTDLAMIDVLNVLESNDGISQKEIIDGLIFEDSAYKAGTVKNALNKLLQFKKIRIDNAKKYFLVNQEPIENSEASLEVQSV